MTSKKKRISDITMQEFGSGSMTANDEISEEMIDPWSASSPPSSSGKKKPATTTTTTTKNTKCRVFIISTDQDKEYHDRLVVQLYPLRDRGYIESWGSSLLLTTDQNNQQSSSQQLTSLMESSNIFLLLISPNFIAAKSIRQIQVAFATKRAEEDKDAIVISIVVRAVHWSELPALHRFPALPTNLVPVKKWGDDQDDAWLDVEIGIIQAIQIFKGEASESGILHPNPLPGFDDGDSCSASAASIDSSSRRRGFHMSRIEPTMGFLNETTTAASPLHQTNQSQKAKIFISYVHEDVEYRNRLEVQLHHLEENGYVESWTYDEKTLSSSKQPCGVREAMESCSIFLLLISPDYIVNESILQYQVNYAIHRVEEGTAQIISIIVRHVNWFGLSSLNKYQALPTSLYPVQEFEDQDEAWLDVGKGIRQAIRSFNGEDSLSVILNPNPITGISDDDLSQGSPFVHITIPSMIPIDECEDTTHNNELKLQKQPEVDHQQEKKCKVFISYSHKDPQYRDRLEVQLKHLLDRGLVDSVDYWSDNQILPGMDWDSTIHRAMEAAHVFLLLVSPDFIASRFIMEEEVPYAMKRAEEKAEKPGQVIAILVRSVNWSDMPKLNHFQTFPSNLRPIKKWKDQDAAWLDVEKGIIQAIQIFTGDVVDALATMASPAVHVMRVYSSSSSSVGDSISDLESTTSSLFSSKGPPLHFHRITDFWTANLNEGRLISINCTLSRYAPMAIGSPFKKRDAHLKFRKIMSDPEQNADEAKLNSLLSFTAGQMAWSIDFEELPWKFFGVYQSIIRNSIPLFVHQDYYRNFVEKLFQTSGKTFNAHVIARVICLPDDFSALFSDDKLIGTNVVKPQIFDHDNSDEEERPVYGLLVDPTADESTSISFKEPATYLDGDIWVAIQTNDGGRISKTSIHTRFCNLADESDIAGQISDLKNELKEKYPNGYRVVFQFDQLERRFKGTQKLETKEIMGIAIEST